MRNLHARVERAMQLFEVPGLSLAVIQNGQVSLARGYGQLSIDNSAAVDEYSLFGIASISKTFTATALAMLVDEGRLAWDDPVARWLPDFQLRDPAASREIRLRDLLIHNSGLPEVSGGTIWYGSDLSRREVVHRLRHLRPESSFRSRFAYQNVTFLAAGLLLEAACGQGWDEFVHQRIFWPLGMQRSTTGYNGLSGRDNIAQPHWTKNGVLTRTKHRSHDNVGPAASIYTCAYDLARYARLHLAAGAWEGQALFSAVRSTELFSPQMVIPESIKPLPSRFLSSAFNSYGLGWYIREINGEKVVSHSGGVDGFRTLLTLVPGRQLAVIVLSNSESPVTHALTASILADAFGQPDETAIERIHEALSGHKQREQAEQASRDALRHSGTRPSLPLDAYEGDYRDPLVDGIEVNHHDGRLFLEFLHTPAFTADLEHWHYDTFQLLWRDEYVPTGLVTFQLNSAGKPQRLQFDQPNLLDVDFSELDPIRAVEPSPVSS